MPNVPLLASNENTASFYKPQYKMLKLSKKEMIMNECKLLFSKICLSYVSLY